MATRKRAKSIEDILEQRKRISDALIGDIQKTVVGNPNFDQERVMRDKKRYDAANNAATRYLGSIKKSLGVDGLDKTTKETRRRKFINYTTDKAKAVGGKG